MEMKENQPIVKINLRARRLEKQKKLFFSIKNKNLLAKRF